MNPKPGLLKHISSAILWLPMPFMLLAAGLKYITWNTFWWYLLGITIYLSLIVIIGTCIEMALTRSLKSSKTGFYHRLIFRYFQWKLLNFFVPEHALLAYPFMLFATFELPEAFKEGGMKLVWLKVDSWGDSFKLKMDKVFDEIVARKKRQEELAAMTPEQREEEFIKVMQQENQIRQLYSKSQHWGDEEFKLKLDQIFESFDGSFEEKMKSASKALKEAEERWKPKMEARKQAALEAVARLNAKA